MDSITLGLYTGVVRSTSSKSKRSQLDLGQGFPQVSSTTKWNRQIESPLGNYWCSWDRCQVENDARWERFRFMNGTNAACWEKFCSMKGTNAASRISQYGVDVRIPVNITIAVAPRYSSLHYTFYSIQSL